jgi:hypothetical protein
LGFVAAKSGPESQEIRQIPISLGMNEHIPNLAIEQFKQQSLNAGKRGIPFLFSLETWWAWWAIDDRSAKRGGGKDRSS